MTALATRWYLRRARIEGMVLLVVEERAATRRGRCAYVNDRPGARRVLPHLRAHLLAEIDPLPPLPVRAYSPVEADG